MYKYKKYMYTIISKQIKSIKYTKKCFIKLVDFLQRHPKNLADFLTKPAGKVVISKAERCLLFQCESNLSLKLLPMTPARNK